MFIVPVSTSLQRRAFRPSFSAPVLSPRLDVVERDGGYRVVLDMPGVTKDQLDVQVDGRSVTVTTKAAPAEAPAAGAEQRILYRERGSAPYARTVTLPVEVDNAQSQARLENGVLTLTLAKRSATRIQVN